MLKYFVIVGVNNNVISEIVLMFLVFIGNLLIYKLFIGNYFLE